MRVVITGASGNLGTALLRRLRADGHELVGVSRRRPPPDVEPYAGVRWYPLDLGTADELRNRYGFEDAQGGGTGFASLHLQGDKVMVLKQDLSRQEFQPLQEGSRLFTEVGPSATAPVKLGHIYLVRITDKKDKSTQQLVKLIVISFRPEEAVTLRWELL